MSKIALYRVLTAELGAMDLSRYSYSIQTPDVL